MVQRSCRNCGAAVAGSLVVYFSYFWLLVAAFSTVAVITLVLL